MPQYNRFGNHWRSRYVLRFVYNPLYKEPYCNRPQLPKLTKDFGTDVCIIGSGIAGISTAYELVTRGSRVTMIEARDFIFGESGRTTGHLSSALDAT